MPSLGSFFGRSGKGLLKRLQRAGAHIPDDCDIIGTSDFGSEPYLIVVGHNVTISAHCSLITHDGGTRVFRNRPGYEHVISFGSIHIGDGSFIGMRSIIMPGVHIGANSVIGAGSVVTKDVPAGWVYAGNPARPICTVDDYAQRKLAQTPEYSRDALQANKQQYLEELYLGRRG
jgi:acetyltransferase-like isoleucine patch superfamily enzyme